MRMKLTCFLVASVYLSPLVQQLPWQLQQLAAVPDAAVELRTALAAAAAAVA